MKKLVLAGVGVLVLAVVAGVVALRATAPIEVAAGLPFSKPGRYLAPTGTQIVDVWAEPDGRLKFFVSRNDRSGPSGGGPTATFRADSDWIMCWNPQDELWTYIPESDRQYCYCWYSNPQGSGSRCAGEFGGWQGIPDAFLARLPQPVQKTYQTALRNSPSAAKKTQPAGK